MILKKALPVNIETSQKYWCLTSVFFSAIFKWAKWYKFSIKHVKYKYFFLILNAEMCTHKEKSIWQPCVYTTVFISPLAEKKCRQWALLNEVTFRELWFFFTTTLVTLKIFISITWINLSYIFEIQPVKFFARKQNFHLLKSPFCAYCQNDTCNGIKRLNK